MGSYLPTGNMACAYCPTGKISSATAATVCTDCTAGKYSYPQFQGNVCENCPTGKYAEIVAASVCTDCAAGKYYTLTGASVCTNCAAGKYNPGVGAYQDYHCISCGAGKYSTTVGATTDSTCISCPAGTTSPAGSSQCTAPGCPAGFTGLDAQSCVSCAAGKYKAAVSFEACSDCGAGQYSTTVGATVASTCIACPANSQPATGTAASSCLCYAGFRLHNGACAACPHGTFKEAVGNASLQGEGCALYYDCCACGVSRWTVDSGTVNSQDCVCIAGYEGAACESCAVGFFKTELSNAACEACPAGATTSSQSSVVLADCVAAPGFFVNVDGGFQPCPAGSFAQTTGKFVCDLCPAGATSPAGASSQSQCNCSLVGWTKSVTETNFCTCAPGHARDSTGWCAPCPAGSFCTGGEATASFCTHYSTSPAGSTAAAACVCNAGYAASASTCQACAAGQYESTGSCEPCPASSSSAAASDAATDCLCIAGYSGPDGGPCVECEVGKYKTPGSAACEACAALETTAGLASVSAAACVCSAGAGLLNGVCTTCASGTFKPQPGDAVCDSCPSFSSSPAGSQAASDCRCEPGYSPDGGTCVACPASFYKTANGSAPCTSCPANSGHLLSAQTLSTACVCDAGYTGEACSACEAGKYKATPGADACTSCPAGSQSPAGSDSPQDCLCVAGYGFIAYAEGAPVCAACPLGKYKADPGNFACTPCQNHSSSISTGSTGACVCDAGYQAQAAQCSACPAGKYKADGGIACTDCPHNSYSAPASTLCECNAGYTGGSLNCTACPAGTYKPAAGSAACAACPPSSTSPPSSTDVTACVCNAGFGGSPGGPCVLCPAGTYQLGDACLACPPNSDSEAGALVCLCRSGYFGLPGGPCQPCAHGTYTPAYVVVKNGQMTFSSSNSSACTACGPNANTSATASISAQGCNCVPGYTSVNGNCQACAADTYKPVLSNASCTACTQHSAAPPASTSPDACACVDDFHKSAGDGTCARVCAAGFEAGGANLADCVGCRPGSYKALEGDHACTPCPPNAFSLLANQTSIASCVCQHGYIFNAVTLLCEACPSGYFNNQANETECFACVTMCGDVPQLLSVEWIQAMNNNIVLPDGVPTQDGIVLSPDGMAQYNPNDAVRISSVCFSANADPVLSYSLQPNTTFSLLVWKTAHKILNRTLVNGLLQEIMEIKNIGIGFNTKLTYPGGVYRITIDCLNPSSNTSSLSTMDFVVNQPPEGSMCSVCRLDCVERANAFNTSVTSCACDHGSPNTTFRHSCNNWTDVGDFYTDFPLQYKFEYMDVSGGDAKVTFDWGPSNFVDIRFPSPSGAVGVWNVWAKVRDAFGAESKNVNLNAVLIEKGFT